MNILPPFLAGLALLVVGTAFVKIATTLNILRYGLGLKDSVFGAVVLALSLIMAVVVSEQVSEKTGANIYREDGSVQVAEAQKAFKPFMQKNTRPELVERLGSFKANAPEGAKVTVETASFGTLGLAFVLTELQKAFEVGLLLLVPFLLIDLLVVNVLMLLGVTQISAAALALPLKLLLFVSVDGWALCAEKLLGAYL